MPLDEDDGDLFGELDAVFARELERFGRCPRCADVSSKSIAGPSVAPTMRSCLSQPVFGGGEDARDDRRASADNPMRGPTDGAVEYTIAAAPIAWRSRSSFTSRMSARASSGDVPRSSTRWRMSRFHVRATSASRRAVSSSPPEAARYVSRSSGRYWKSRRTQRVLRAGARGRRRRGPSCPRSPDWSADGERSNIEGPREPRRASAELGAPRRRSPSDAGTQPWDEVEQRTCHRPRARVESVIGADVRPTGRATGRGRTPPRCCVSEPREAVALRRSSSRGPRAMGSLDPGVGRRGCSRARDVGGECGRSPEAVLRVLEQDRRA